MGYQATRRFLFILILLLMEPPFYPSLVSEAGNALIHEINLTPGPENILTLPGSTRIFPTVFDDFPNMTLEDQVINIEQFLCNFYCEKINLFNISFKGRGFDCVDTVPAGEGEMTDVTLRNAFLFTKCHSRAAGVRQTDHINHNSDPSLVDKCENPDLSIPAQGIPVLDNGTRFSYRNVFCARCNNVPEENIEVWSVKIHCNKGPNVLYESIKEMSDIYRTLTTKEGVEETQCFLQYLPRDEDKYIQKCQKLSPDIIETCNETGYWRPEIYHPDIERACLMYSSIFLQKYKNLFCYLCNINESLSKWELDAVKLSTSESNVARLGFSALFDFDDSENDGNDESDSAALIESCSKGKFFDNIACSCQTVQCSEGKYFIEDTRTCQNSFDQISLLGYTANGKIYIGLTRALTLKEFRMTKTLSLLEMGTTHAVNRTLDLHWCPGHDIIEIDVKMWEISDSTHTSLTDYEERFQSLAEYYCDLIRLIQEPVPVLTCRWIYVEDYENRDINSTCLIDKFTYFSDYNISSKLLSKYSYFRYLRTNTCPFVEIMTSDFNVSGDWLMHHLSGQRLSRWLADFVKNHSRIRVCRDDYLKWTSGTQTICFDPQKQANSFDTWTTAGLISIICSSISLLCLALTLITYVLFDQIKTEGAHNIMALTVILFLATGFYEFTIEQYERKTLCSVFGVLIHYLWLAAVFSMNACTIERFATICLPLKSQSYFLTKKSKYISLLYSCLSPLCIVGCNIIVNILVNGDLGYGNAHLCYINGQKSRIFAFGVPICLVALINVMLFFVTISTVRKQTLITGKGDTQTRIGFLACVRLSVVTGSTWLISLLYEAFPLHAIGYVFTALLGLQGVIFFLSIIVNKKIIDLYRDLFFNKAVTEHDSSKSGDGTAAKTRKLKRFKEKGKKYISQPNTVSRFPSDNTSTTQMSKEDSGFFADVIINERNEQ